MPRTGWGWLITPEELESWTLHRDDELFVVNKPAHVVCHPSKHGPWSSLVGAAREYLGAETLHMPSRLDRETSGVVVFARNPELASRLQKAMEQRLISKVYHAILSGELAHSVRVDQPIGKAAGSVVVMRRGVVPGGAPAVTDFEPVAARDGYTLARIVTYTGRLHQIRVHAHWLGHPIVGDKIYGPDERLFLDFIEEGWTDRHQELLHLSRHALHASTWTFRDEACSFEFHAPLPGDWEPLLRRLGHP